MKKIIALIALIALCLPLCACASTSLEEQSAKTQTKEEVKTKAEKEETKEEAKKDEPFVFDPPKDCFSVGYSRVDITPAVPIHTYDGAIAHKIHDPIQMTCVAMCDGANVFLLYTLDLRGIPTSFAKYSAEKLEKEFGIPSSNVFLNCSHTHTSPDTTEEPDVLKWRQLFLQQLPVAAEEALRDLTPAKAYGGTSHTEGITFVRRYLLADGTYKCNPGSGSNVVAHESEADTEMRVVRFRREGKKDVLMVNYQTHYGSVGSLYPDSVSADFVHWLREDVEKEMDCHFAYVQGAAGNLNFQSVIPGERKYPTFVDAIPALVEDIQNAVAAESELATGTIHGDMSDYEGKSWDYETNTITGSRDIYLRAVGFGDLGFVGAPYEMFDITGQQIRAASPYKMTFISAYTGGRNGYVPHAEGYEHGAYEAQWGCMVAPGSGEEFAAELLRLLGECKAKG
ncbi:MAG: hypothetical protein E7580_01465 [Ruminococcaceae bacterium]|nr:hypothetical protein [Oscillospiraceae bacterium]